MVNTLISIIQHILEGPTLKKRDKHISPHYTTFIRDVVNSCKFEGQIESCIDWIHDMYRKGLYTKAIHQELTNHAIYKEAEIIKEKIHRDFICPHIKKRANEIIEEERRKTFRLLKTETPQSL